MRTLKILVVVLCFILDVRVRASDEFVTMVSQSGSVEMDKNQDTVDVETFKDGTAKLDFEGREVGLGPQTFATISKNKIQLHFGHLFFSTRGKDVLISTRHGEVRNVPDVETDAEFTIDESDHKTTVNALSGQVKINDRLGSTDKTLRAGYSLWVGGLKSDGTKVMGSQEAINYERAMEDLKSFAGISAEDLPVALDHLKLNWKSAVDDVAMQTQDQVNGDMKSYREWQMANKKREIASIKEKRELKSRFRAHALDLPYQNEESPSE